MGQVHGPHEPASRAYSTLYRHRDDRPEIGGSRAGKGVPPVTKAYVHSVALWS